MAGICCPFCKQLVSEHSSTVHVSHINFWGQTRENINNDGDSGLFHLHALNCPNCKRISFKAFRRENQNFEGPDAFCVPIYPQVPDCQHFPDYIPQAIRNDYEEACAVLNLSPKSSATLCRRCLQGMIRDFWGIHEKNLNAEITALKGKIPIAQWNALDALRGIGNIGAHMEHDVNLIIDIEPGEAIKLLRLIELLIKDWYVARHDQEELYEQITSIGVEKQQQRKA